METSSATSTTKNTTNTTTNTKEDKDKDKGKGASFGLGSLSFGSGAAFELDQTYAQMEKAENSKLKTYDTQKESVETKLSAYSTLKGSLEALKSQAEALSPSNLQKSASATTSAVAYIPKATDSSISGTYDIQVNQLATTQSNVSAKINDKTSKLGSGSISLQQGSDAAVSVPIKNASLEGVRDAINAAKDSNGNRLNIAAVVLSDEKGGSYLSVSSTKTGARSAFTLSATGDSGLTDVISNMSVKKEAANAKFSINSVDLEANSNVVTSAVPGLELTLSSVSTKPETTTVGNNIDEWASSIANFARSYNSFLTTVSGLTKYEAPSTFNKGVFDTSKSGALLGDPGSRTILNQVKHLMSGSNLAALKDFGITTIDFSKANATTPVGSLQVDFNKLTQSVANNPEGIKKVLSGNGGKNGLMSQVVAKVDELENEKSGLLTISTKSLDDKAKNITKQKERATETIESRLKAYKQSLIRLVKFRTSIDQQMKGIESQFETMRKSK